MAINVYADFKPSDKFENKYNMTREQNVFLAKRNIVDSIWKSANLEGVNITYPDTYSIYENGVVSGLKVDEIITVINLKHGWQYMLNEVGNPTTFETLCEIQALVARDQALTLGVLRTGTVGISGTDYIPDIPKENVVREQFDYLMNNPDPTDRALNVMCWAMKSQLFFDGNKRTAMLAANKILIENGCGIISVSADNLVSFHTLLSDYYTNNRIDEFKSFVYENCIDGIIFEKERAFPKIEVTHDKQITGDLDI